VSVVKFAILWALCASCGGIGPPISQEGCEESCQKIGLHADYCSGPTCERGGQHYEMFCGCK